MSKLLLLINELERNISFSEQKRETVSKASVGWHIEHSLLALVKMISAVEHSNPKDFKKQFNWKRTLVLCLNKFPRGKAKAPESVKPNGEITIESIDLLLKKAKEKAELLESLSSDKYFTHPVFGDVQVKQARKVIAIHTKHHIHIINDILGK